MKAERNYPRYTVTAKAEAAILRGHPWVYDAEITATEGQAENGGKAAAAPKKLGAVPTVDINAEVDPEE